MPQLPPYTKPNIQLPITTMPSNQVRTQRRRHQSTNHLPPLTNKPRNTQTHAILTRPLQQIPTPTNTPQPHSPNQLRQTQLTQATPPPPKASPNIPTRLQKPQQTLKHLPPIQTTNQHQKRLPTLTLPPRRSNQTHSQLPTQRQQLLQHKFPRTNTKPSLLPQTIQNTRNTRHTTHHTIDNNTLLT